MNKLHHILMTCLFTATCGIAFAQEAEPGAPKPEGRPPRQFQMQGDRPGPGGFRFSPQMLKRIEKAAQDLQKKADDPQFKADTDLQALQEQQRELNAKIRNARMYMLFKIIDTNANGKFDDDEIEKANEAIQAYMEEHPELRGVIGGGMGMGGMGMGMGGRGGMGRGQGGPRGEGMQGGPRGEGPQGGPRGGRRGPRPGQPGGQPPAQED